MTSLKELRQKASEIGLPIGNIIDRRKIADWERAIREWEAVQVSDEVSETDQLITELEAIAETHKEAIISGNKHGCVTCDRQMNQKLHEIYVTTFPPSPENPLVRYNDVEFAFNVEGTGLGLISAFSFLSGVIDIGEGERQFKYFFFLKFYTLLSEKGVTVDSRWCQRQSNRYFLALESSNLPETIIGTDPAGEVRVYNLSDPFAVKRGNRTIRLPKDAVYEAIFGRSDTRVLASDKARESAISCGF